LVAVLAEETVVDEAVLRVEVVEDHVGVATMAGRENDDLEVLAEVFQDLLRVGADVDAGLDDLAGGEGDGEFDVEGRGQGVVAVDERLVEVEDDGLAA
jgi:hypothetical protein